MRREGRSTAARRRGERRGAPSRSPAAGGGRAHERNDVNLSSVTLRAPVPLVPQNVHVGDVALGLYNTLTY